KTSAIRIHALARSLGIQKASVVGHDIGLMVAYGYAAQFPQETEKLAVWMLFFRASPAGRLLTTIRTCGTSGFTGLFRRSWYRDGRRSTSAFSGIFWRAIKTNRFRQPIAKHT